jgi:lipopolysaccharide export system protein LptA
VALAGIGTAVALYVLTRERPSGPRMSSSTPADPAATVQTGQGTQVRYKGSDKQFTLEYGSVKQYPDGRTGWTAVHLTLEDGTKIAADQAETVGKAVANGAPGEMLLSGHVTFETSDGVAIRAEHVQYTDAIGRATIPGAVAFARGRMSGTGTGAIYERDTGVFNLLADAHVTIAADDRDGQVDATAARMTFNKAGNALLFEDHARIAHGPEVMTATRATLYMTEDHERFRVIELRGEARVTPAPGQTSKTPDMQAQDIDMAFYEDSQGLQRALLNGQATMVLTDARGRRSISATTIMMTTAADGQTLTHLEGHERVVTRTPARADAPERTITAAALVANGDDAKGLTAAQFSGGVRFVEIIPATAGARASQRTGTSQTLNLKLAGQIDAIDEAQFQQDVNFTAGDVTGSADVGVYSTSKGQLTLLPAGRSAKRLPHVSDGTIAVDAAELIDVALDTHDLHARRDVKTVTTGKPAPAGAPKDQAGSPGLFDEGEPTYGFGAEFWYDGGAGRARYLGTPANRAMIKQTDNQVTAVDVTLVDATKDLSASGSVESVFLLVDQNGGGGTPAKTSAPGSGPASTPKTPTRATAESLVYTDSSRTATYDGTPVTMTGPDGTTTSTHLVLTLAAESRTLDRLEATGNVHANLSQGREALADVLVYEAVRGRYTLRGHPFVVRESDVKAGTCARTTALVGYFTNNDEAPEFPDSENPGGVNRSSSKGVCTGELTR